VYEAWATILPAPTQHQQFGVKRNKRLKRLDHRNARAMHKSDDRRIVPSAPIPRYGTDVVVDEVNSGCKVVHSCP